jgi:hypothetical protein
VAGVRREFTMAIVRSVRQMHVFAVRSEDAEFERTRRVLQKLLEKFWHAHTSLVSLNRLGTSLVDAFDWNLQPYLSLQLPVQPVEYSSQKGLRAIISGGADAVARLMIAAGLCADESAEAFAGFRKAEPYSFPSLWYVLENVHITAKAMDEASINYLMEASHITRSLRLVFILVSIFAAGVESGVAVVLFRRTILTRTKNLLDQVGRHVRCGLVGTHRAACRHCGQPAATVGRAAADP